VGFLSYVGHFITRSTAASAWAVCRIQGCGVGSGETVRSPGASEVSTTHCGVPKDVSWSTSVSETSSSVFWVLDPLVELDLVSEQAG